MEIPIIGIEEPEVAVHPHALGILLDALLDASQHRQIVITSHSPDLLDRPGLEPESLLAVSIQHGATVVTPIDVSLREAMHKHLCTAGELLRQNQIQPDPSELKVAKGRQSNLFELITDP